jgi:hypothetical protein
LETEEALAGYVALDEVHDFYKQLMKSRYYRTVSFLTYLTGDHDQLRWDMDRWDGAAADLTVTMSAPGFWPRTGTSRRWKPWCARERTPLSATSAPRSLW